MSERLQKLSFVEKAGYSLGDAAANFVFQALIIFQLQFYTDTFGLAAAAAGTLLLVGRLWDAFFDPLMGAIADRTNTRWGKFRPWVLWTAVPWAVVMFLAYTTPHFGGTGKLIYACVTNILLMTLYSANNTPYSALTGVMTGDVNERTSLSTYRFVAALCAGLLVGGFTLPLVAKFGQGDSAKGWQMTMGLWALVCVVFFFTTFATVRERIQPDPRQKSSARRDLRDLLKNGPWIAMFLFTVVHLMAVAMRGGTMTYYFKYNVDQDRLFAFLKGWGLTAPADGSNPGGVWHYLLNTFGLIIDPKRTNVSQVGFSLLNMSSQFITIVGIMCATWLAIRFGKKAVVIAGFAGALLFMALFIVVPTDSIWTIFATDWARAICYAPTIPLVWAMFADVVDYSEWITGRRATGLIYAAIVFGLKAGLSLGGAIAGWLLSAFGYQANVQQTDHALWGIRLIVSVIPAGLLGVCLVCVVCYRITKKLNLQIQDELAERRKQYAAVSHGVGPVVAE